MPITNYPNGLSSFGVPLLGGPVMPTRRVLWVKKAADADYASFLDTHQAYDDAYNNLNAVYNTFTAALAAAGDFDVIIGLPGVYDEGAVLNITQRGLKLLGVQNSGMQWGQPSIKGLAASTTLINVKADQVEIAGLGFTQNSANKIISIAEDTWGLNTWRTHIHDCFFGGNTVATYGVWSGGIGTEALATIVERCRFYDCLTGVRQNGGLGMVRDSYFQVMTAGVGVEDVPNASSRPSRAILDNRFVTIDATNAVGVKVTNTPDAGQLFIDGNRFKNFADDNHCISRRTGYTGLNYQGVTVVAVT